MAGNIFERMKAMRLFAAELRATTIEVQKKGGDQYESQFIGHRLRPPFLPKSFSIDMWIKRLTLINIHDSFKSSFNSTISKYKSKLIARIFGENRTPPQLSILNHLLFRAVLSNNSIVSLSS